MGSLIGFGFPLKENITIKIYRIVLQVFVLLRNDSRLPVWDASSGNLVRIYLIPAVPNSIRGIVPTPGLAGSRGFQVFIQTNKTDQVKYIS